MNAMDMENTTAASPNQMSSVLAAHPHLEPGKDYLPWENARNRTHKKLYAEMLQECFGEGVLIAHHLCFTGKGDVVEEIPSADTMIFDHHIMGRLFGDNAMQVMMACLKEPAETRDDILADAFYNWRRIGPMATNIANPARAGAIAAGFKGSNPAEQGAIAAATDGWSTSVKAD